MSEQRKRERDRVCARCGQTKPLYNYKSTQSDFFPRHRATICTQCLEQMAPPDDLNKVDALMRYLDLPFDINEWTRLYEQHKEHTLSAYFELLADERYEAINWAIENERWRIAREQDTFDEEVEVMSKAEMGRLRNKWSEFYSAKELRFLEEYYNQICATQNVSTPILREYACDLCELELQIKKGVRSSEDVKKLMDARDNIIKMAHFEASNSKNAADFDSVGEVITYYTKKGWHPKWHTEPKDSIDFLMNNVQGYLRRLVVNEGNFAEQVEDKKESFNLTERLAEEDEFNYEEGVKIEYEGEDEFAAEISDFTEDD